MAAGAKCLKASGGVSHLGIKSIPARGLCLPHPHPASNIGLKLLTHLAELALGMVLNCSPAVLLRV